MRKRREGNSNIFKKINQQKKFQKEENFSFQKQEFP